MGLVRARDDSCNNAKPWRNATDESFNGKFRDEFLRLQWFRNRMDAKVSIEQWRQHYNEVRPHSSLDYLTPAEFKAQLGAGSGRCCMNTRCGWGGVARTSRDPPQEPHYGDELEGSSQV